MKLIAHSITLLFLFSTASALPFSDDMVENQLGSGQVVRQRPEGTVPVGSLNYILAESKEEAKALKNPTLSDEYSVKRGQRLFQVNCAACHGEISATEHVAYPAGAQMGAPNLALENYHSRTDGEIYSAVHFGNLIMPAVGWKISPAETWDIVNYVRSVQGQTKIETKQENK